MSTLRVPVHPLERGLSRLDEATSRYIVRVHRLGVGATFVAFDPEMGLEALAELVSDRHPRAEVRVGEIVPSTSRVPWSLTLFQAVGKGTKPEQVVREATVLGARRVVFLDTERSVARASSAGRLARERRVAVEAARQSGRGDLPDISGPHEFGAGLSLLADDARRLVCCWHSEARPLLSELAEWQPEQELALLIGPEGGLAPREIDEVMSIGFRPVTLGAFVLRTETAALVALGLAQGYAAAHFRAESAS